jgi:hypothetical protein
VTVSEALRDRLAAVGLDPQGARVLALLPLVHVAWADGTLHHAERRLIDEQARLLAPTADGTLALANWLAFPPSPELVRRGTEALALLLAESGPGSPPPKAIVAYCRRVARAAGGVLGFGATTRAEQAAITQIARALQVAPGRPWTPPPEVPSAPSPTSPWAGAATFHTRELDGIRSVAVLTGGGDDRCPIDGVVVIGRGADCDIQLGEDGAVSRRHCELEPRSGRFYVRDLGSTSGTWVDGDRVLERRLFGGESLRIGGSTFRFERRDVKLLLTE